MNLKTKKKMLNVAALFYLSLVLVLCSCKGKIDENRKKEVVVYTSLDKVFSEPVLKAFEKG